MEFHTFGDKNKKTVMLLHGALTPWQIWDEQIKVLQRDYYVIVPAFEGHIEEYESEFISVEDEADKLETYIKRELNGKVFAICGLSMGGVIAEKLFEKDSVLIDYLILDGSSIVKGSNIPIKLIVRSYQSIVSKSKARDKKTIENFKNFFLPEKYLNDYLKIIDTMTETTVDNMINSVFGSVPFPCKNSFGTKIMFMHGTKFNEYYAKKSAMYMKKHYPDTRLVCFRGMGHAELAVYYPERWLKTVKDFISS